MSIYCSTYSCSSINDLLIPLTIEVINLNPYRSELISNHIYHYFIECMSKVMIWRAYEYSLYEVLVSLDIECVNLSRKIHIKLSSTYELYIEISLYSLIQSGKVYTTKDYILYYLNKVPGVIGLNLDYELMENSILYTSLELDVISISKLDSLHNLGISHVQQLRSLYSLLLSNHINKECLMVEIEKINKDINMEL